MYVSEGTLNGSWKNARTKWQVYVGAIVEIHPLFYHNFMFSTNFLIITVLIDLKQNGAQITSF